MEGSGSVQIITDPDLGCPKTYGSGTLVVGHYKCTSFPLNYVAGYLFGLMCLIFDLTCLNALLCIRVCQVCGWRCPCVCVTVDQVYSLYTSNGEISKLGPAKPLKCGDNCTNLTCPYKRSLYISLVFTIQHATLYTGQCCGSGTGIRCLFDPWIRDPE